MNMLPNNQNQQPMILFAYGFRSFFLLASLCSLSVMIGWLLQLEQIWQPTPYISPTIWHAHEMVFGFVAASAAGFLLTASPNWSNRPPLKGRPLMVLVFFWIVGRFAFSMAPLLNPWLVTLLDMLFSVALVVVTGPPLWNTGNRAHRFFPILLTLFACGNALIHGQALGFWDDTARIGLYLGIDAIIFFLVMVGGHIMPMFTRNALVKEENLPPFKIIPALEISGAVTMVAVVVADIIGLGEPWGGPILLAAGIVQAIRLSKWHSVKTLSIPLLWVLHLGFAWLVVGLILRAIAQMTELLSLSTALHGLNIGAMGLFTLGIMSRVSIAHTGRALTKNRPILTIAYTLMALAAIIRVLAADMMPLWSLRVSGLLWILATLLFLLKFTPILLRPRTDGQPG